VYCTRTSRKLQYVYTYTYFEILIYLLRRYLFTFFSGSSCVEILVVYPLICTRTFESTKVLSYLRVSCYMYVYSCTHIDRIVYVYFRHARGPTKPYLLAS